LFELGITIWMALHIRNCFIVLYLSFVLLSCILCFSFLVMHFYVRQLYRQVLLRARISHGNSVRLSVRLSWCHDPVPNPAQVR